MKFTLTFEGRLTAGSSKKAAAKHERRRVIHRQLKRLWQTNPLLSNWMIHQNDRRDIPAREALAETDIKFPGFQFVPLIAKNLSLETALHFHILRPTTFKGNIPDVDNLVKILIDSLKKPQNIEEIPKNSIPSAEENPFYVLMQDDSQISKLTSVSDELLEPLYGKAEIEANDVRLMIDVYIRPNYPRVDNLIFFSDDFEIWNHQWTSSLDGIRGWSNSELKARITQCILRMRITAINFKMQDRALLSRRPYLSENPRAEFEALWDKQMADHQAQNREQHTIWNGRLRPIALALLDELKKRISSDAPYPRERDLSAIEEGRLSGPDPLEDAATALESLMRQLP